MPRWEKGKKEKILFLWTSVSVLGRAQASENMGQSFKPYLWKDSSMEGKKLPFSNM